MILNWIVENRKIKKEINWIVSSEFGGLRLYAVTPRLRKLDGGPLKS